MANDETDTAIMAAYRAILAYACVESFKWLEDTIKHRGYLRFTAPRNVTNHRDWRKSIDSHTNHQLKWVRENDWLLGCTNEKHESVRKYTSFTADDDRRLKQYLGSCLRRGHTLGSISIYKRLVCKVCIYSLFSRRC